MEALGKVFYYQDCEPAVVLLGCFLTPNPLRSREVLIIDGFHERKKGDLIIKYGYGSIPIDTIFRGMNIHLPAILMFTRGTRF
jgi:hypothetical protein